MSPPDWRRQRCAGANAAIAVVLATVLSGCEPYRIEYVDVPEYYERGVQGGMPDRVELPDGTVRVYRSKKTGLPYKSDDKPATKFEIRREHTDGTITLHARLPEHVVANLIACLHREEYELIFSQMLAESTRSAYELEGGLDQFTDYVRRYRKDILTLLNRMQRGIVGQDVVLERQSDGSIQCRLRPHLARDFVFRAVVLVMDAGELRLLALR